MTRIDSELASSTSLNFLHSTLLIDLKLQLQWPPPQHILQTTVHRPIQTLPNPPTPVISPPLKWPNSRPFSKHLPRPLVEPPHHQHRCCNLLYPSLTFCPLHDFSLYFLRTHLLPNHFIPSSPHLIRLHRHHHRTDLTFFNASSQVLN